MELYWFCIAAGDSGDGVGGSNSDSDSDGDDSGGNSGCVVWHCGMCDNKYNGYISTNNNNNENNNDDGPNDKHKQTKLQIVEDKQIIVSIK